MRDTLFDTPEIVKARPKEYPWWGSYVFWPNVSRYVYCAVGSDLYVLMTRLDSIVEMRWIGYLSIPVYLVRLQMCLSFAAEIRKNAPLYALQSQIE